MKEQIGVGTAEHVRTFTKSALGAEVPISTMETWVSLGRTIRIADDIIDNQPDALARQSIYEGALGFLNGKFEQLPIQNIILSQEMSSLKSHLNTVTGSQRIAFLRNLKSLLKITERVKNTDDPTTLAKLVMLEGQLTARLFISFLPKDFYALDEYREYLYYFTRLSRGINTFDSIVDFKSDYEQGKTKVKPTVRNITIFTATAIPNALHVIAKTRPGLLKSFGRGAMTITKDRNGESPIHFSDKQKL